MQVSIQDKDALLEITPDALSAYARIAGWSQQEIYREHSDIYVGDKLPEILVPRHERLGDYVNVVATLIRTFAQVTDQDELTIYRSLITADRDVIRLRVSESEDGSLGLSDGLRLISGARDMVLAAACSLNEPRPVYQTGTDKDAKKLLQQMRLGQTDEGSFVISLLTPVMQSRKPIHFREPGDQNTQSIPAARQMTKRLVEALAEVRRAVELSAPGEGGAFIGRETVGVSANLCEALVKTLKPFSALDVSVSWALTQPTKAQGTTVRFENTDAPLLREAARLLRDDAITPNACISGHIHNLGREGKEAAGTIRLRTRINEQLQTVVAVLEREDYERAIQAHSDNAPIDLKGDLKRSGQQWKLLNPKLADVLQKDERDSEGS